jgi:hypothetical protein
VASLRALVATAAAVAVLIAGGAAVASKDSPSARFVAHARAIDGSAGPRPVNATARTAITWRGGPITASTGEVVNVFVSDLLPAETPEKWAEFLVGLTHGPELTQVTARIATLAEVRELCGQQALGCYRRNEITSLGEVAPTGATPEEVLRHEYGHHVGFHRTNAPWRAVEWGPKNWASVAGVCPRVSRGEAFPGGGGRNYAQNPGEAWAEVYRLMDERKAGVATGRWDIIARSFFPSEAALAAAEKDVLAPWEANTTSTHRRVFGTNAKRIWWIPVSTPLDGQLTLSATRPRNGTQEVAIVSPDRRRVLRKALWTGRRVVGAISTVCGQRSLLVRVMSQSRGAVTVKVSTP